MRDYRKPDPKETGTTPGEVPSSPDNLDEAIKGIQPPPSPKPRPPQGNPPKPEDA